ncbi:MAG: DNA primase [Gammaproteobacteria bacterium]|nr:DNA primase [Gammaproteobacteria bacterium]
MADFPSSRSGQFGREFLNDLTNRIDGPAFLSRFLKVEKSGDRYRALCPFHKDSKPSMYIRDDGSFYCFGCQKKGSVFNFLMEQNGVSFPDAVKDVAQFLGVPLPERPGSVGLTKEQRALLDVLQKSALFFSRQLEHAGSNTIVKKYLVSRGFDRTAVEKYQIGFAPNAWTSLKEHLADTEERTLIDADVLVDNQDRNSVYDRYRNRLMFPIRNRQGDVVGFGGRTLDDSVEPKYLNTKQTKVFSKSRELYGLFEVLNIDRRPKRLLLVEGYTDVVALSQHGIPYAVAALGTASNDSHFRTMFWFTNEVICCFDGDDAGRTAAKRALESALAALTDEKTVKFMFLPEGEDPDSFVRSNGKTAFEDFVNNAQHVADYFVDSVLETKDRTFASIEQKARFVDRAKSLIQGIKHDSFRVILAQEVAQCFPDDVNMQQLLAPVFSVRGPETPSSIDTYDDDWSEREPDSQQSGRFYDEITTRLRVSQLLCAHRIWRSLTTHRELLHRLVEVANDHPMTRLWSAIDRYGFSEVSGLIASFQGDEWFVRYLNEVYDRSNTQAMVEPEETLEQFVDGVEAFLTSIEKDIERKTI